MKYSVLVILLCILRGIQSYTCIREDALQFTQCRVVCRSLLHNVPICVLPAFLKETKASDSWKEWLTGRGHCTFTALRLWASARLSLKIPGFIISDCKHGSSSVGTTTATSASGSSSPSPPDLPRCSSPLLPPPPPPQPQRETASA